MKTFNKFLEENPNYFNDNFPLLPTGVADILSDNFYYRYLSDDNRFKIYFRNKLNLKLDEFLALYNKELEFRGLNPFEIENIERTVDTVKNTKLNVLLETLRNFTSKDIETKNLTNLNTKDLSNIETKDLTKTLDTTDTTTDDLTHTKTGTENVEFTDMNNTILKQTGNNTVSGTGTVTTDTNNNLKEIHAGDVKTTDNSTISEEHLNNDYPQIDLGTDNTTNYLTNKNTINNTTDKTNNVLDGRIISNTGNVENLQTNNTTDTTTYNKTDTTDITDNQTNTNTYNTTDKDTGTKSTTNSGTIKDGGTNSISQTGTDTITQTGTDTNDNTSNSTFNSERNNNQDDTINLIYKSLKTGNFVDLYRKYFTTISNMNAVDWLVDELDSCFIQVFDLDDVIDDEYITQLEILTKKVNELEVAVSNLDTRVDALEEGGGGGVTEDYVNNAIETAIAPINTNLNEIGNDLNDLESYISNKNLRTYDIYSVSGGINGKLYVGGSTIEDAEIYIKLKVVDQDSIAAVVGMSQASITNTNDSNLITSIISKIKGRTPMFCINFTEYTHYGYIQVTQTSISDNIVTFTVNYLDMGMPPEGGFMFANESVLIKLV